MVGRFSDFLWGLIGIEPTKVNFHNFLLPVDQFLLIWASSGVRWSVSIGGGRFYSFLYTPRWKDGQWTESYFCGLNSQAKRAKINNDFRPISLCNVIYKVIAKSLVNRLKTVLSEVISKNQSAFVLERLITNNIVAAYEVLHSMKTWQKDKVGSMALKLDIFKAYDRVEWPISQRSNEEAETL